MEITESAVSAVWKYVLPVIVSAVLASLLLAYGWFRRKSALGRVYFMLLLNMTIWMILYSLVMLVKNDLSYYLALLEYLTIVSLPLLWLYFSLDFSAVKGWKSPGSLILTLIVPVVLVAMAVTNLAPNLLVDHHTFYGLARPDNLERMLSPGGERLLWTYVHIAYSVIYFVIGTVLVIKSLNSNPKVDLKQSIILSIGVLVPWIGNITFIFRISPIDKLDLAPFTFTMAAALLAWGLYYNRFVSVVQTARRVLIERMADGLIILDGQNWILDINPSAQKIFRVTNTQIIGMPAENVFKTYPDIMTNLKYISRKHQEIHIQIGKDIKYYDLDINPLYESKGGVLGKMMVFHDVTPIKESEIKLRDAKTKAEEADVLKSAFLANMSHEIRTPMNAIIGFSNLLNDAGVSEEEKSEFIEHIKNSGNSLLHLIDDIIDLSKLDAGQMEVEEQVFSVQRLLSELFSFFNEEIQTQGKTNIQLMVKGISADLDWWVVGDQDKIRRILRNLIDNALKFTHQGYVEFGASYQLSGNLVFYVQDTGIGIALEKQSMIFDRFSRVITGTRQEYGGTGLGLAVCKSLSDLLKANLTLTSTPGKGSTFQFSVAVKKADDYRPPLASLEDFVPKPAEEPLVFVPKPVPVTQPAPETQLPEMPEPLIAATPETWRPKVVEIQRPEVDAASPTAVVDEFAGMTLADIFPDMPEDAGFIFSDSDVPEGGFKLDDSWSANNIMVIESDEMAYLYIEMILRQTKVNLVWVKKLSEADNYFKGPNELDAVILSTQLQDASLQEVVKTIKKHSAVLPILAITPFEGSAVNRQCMELGCAATIPKPLKPAPLMDAIRVYLG